MNVTIATKAAMITKLSGVAFDARPIRSSSDLALLDSEILPAFFFEAFPTAKI